MQNKHFFFWQFQFQPPSHDAWWRWYFWSILVWTRGKCKDMCICVYFEESIYTDIFLNTFYWVWRVVIVSTTHESHPRIYIYIYHSYTGPEFSCCCIESFFFRNRRFSLREKLKIIKALHATAVVCYLPCGGFCWDLICKTFHMASSHCAARPSCLWSVILFTELL